MATTKLARMVDDLNDLIRQEVPHAMSERFDIEVALSFDLLGSMRMVSRRVDGREFTVEQMKWLEAFEKGYLAAMELVGLARDGLPLDRNKR